MDDLDRALAALPRYDVSDQTVDEILRRVHADAEAGTHVEAATLPPAPEPPRRRLGPPAWIALAAGLALAAGAFFVAGSDRAPAPTPVVDAPSGMALKGATTDRPDASISLGLSLLREDVPVALVPGADARTTDTVLLRYTTDSEGFAYLFRRGPSGDLEVFHGTPTLPGTHHVTVGGRIVGYDLGGLSGEHLFGVALSPEPWAPSDGDDAATAPENVVRALSHRGAFPRLVGPVSVDARPVRVGDGTR